MILKNIIIFKMANLIHLFRNLFFHSNSEFFILSTMAPSLVIPDGIDGRWSAIASVLADGKCRDTVNRMGTQHNTLFFILSPSFQSIRHRILIISGPLSRVTHSIQSYERGQKNRRKDLGCSWTAASVVHQLPLTATNSVCLFLLTNSANNSPSQKIFD